MDENWDDDSTSTPTTSQGIGVASEGGCKFSAGRGFKAIESNDDGWGNGNSSEKNTLVDTQWGDAPSDSYNNNRDRRGGGGGRRGGRDHQGGGFKPRRNDDNHSSGGWGNNESSTNDWGDNQNNSNDGWGNSGQDFGGQRRGGGRGGRGGGRGRGSGREDRGGDRDGFKNKDFGGKTENGDEKKREIYIPPESVEGEELFTHTINTGINFMKLDDIEVNVSGENIPNPIDSFNNSGLRAHLLENVSKSGYTKPTPIQKYAIPIILSGRDLMGCAQTGSGKTAAFMLPIINKLLAKQEPPIVENQCAQPNVVIVSPTRELAIQICEQGKKFAHNSIVKVLEVYGGTSVGYQRNRIQSGCHILVATPGRLNDFVNRGDVSFASVEFFVLDEADRMLDMGFLPTVEEMLGHSTMTATGERQTLMFSATFPEQIQHLAGKFLHNYVFIAVGIVGSASSDVEQKILQVSQFEKRHKLIDMLKQSDGKERTLVFVETKRNADFLASLLSESDIQTTSIHGDRLQRERETALRDFKNGYRNILVATGVAARGLDIKGVQHVINYDLPKHIDEYVHRIGRTGRVGNRGKATSFYDPQTDGQISTGLAVILKQADQEVPPFLSDGGYGGRSNDSFGGRDIRGDDYGKAQDFNSQPAEEEEESWD